MTKSRSLQNKLVLLFIIVAAIPLVAVSVFSVYTGHKTLLEDAFETNVSTAKTLSRELDAMVEARFRLLHLAARSPEIVSMDPVRALPALKNVAAQYPDMTSIMLVNPDGRQLARSEGVLGNVADRDYFKGVIGGAPQYVSDVLIARGTGRPGVVLAVPIKNSDNQLVGVLSGTMDLAHLSSLVSQTKVGKTGYVFVVDRNGKALAHPDMKMVSEQQSLADLPPVKAAISGKEGTARYTWDKVQKLAGYSFVPITRWGVVVQLPESEAMAGARQVMYASIVITVLAILLAGILGFFIARIITRPLQQMAKATQALAAGDLTHTVQVNSADELGVLANAFNTMVANLRNLVRQVVITAEQVAAAAEELSASAQEAERATQQIAHTASDLAAGAQQQSREIMETARTVADLSQSAREVATKAESAAVLSQEMAGAAQSGGAAVHKAVSKMEEINKAVAETATMIKDLGDRSKHIGNIVDVITNIAGQTNLLALNAAIEAARAGEQGRGFAVVADEVRKLAEQSQEAAKQISSIIGEIQDQTEKAVEAMDGGTRKVTEGVTVAQEASVSLYGILQKINEIVGMIQSISAAAQQQAAGTSEVVKNIDHVATIAEQSSAGAQTAAAATEETTASVESIAASAQALAESAAQLQSMVVKFRI